MAGERTEQASPQRREKARREGDLLHSRELCAAVGTLAGVGMLGFAAPRFLSAWATAFGGFLNYGRGAAWEPAALDGTLRALLGLAMSALAPVGLVMAAVAAGALASGVVQTGGVQVHPQLAGLRLERINPLSNARNLFSLRSLARLGKSLIPAALLVVFAVERLRGQLRIAPFSSVRMLSLGQDVYDLLLATAWLLFGWAAIDYLVEWRSREQRLRMSRQDMRDEYRESEGNPQIRGRIRNLQRQARRKRMKADVARAAVVITNPTHYAVALDFDFETMDAPRVLAKGRNLLAEEIKTEARWAGVPILENPPLAQSLYKLVEPGEPIPIELYAAVASILAFLYRQRVEQQMRERNQRSRAGGPGGNGSAAKPEEAKITPAPRIPSAAPKRGGDHRGTSRGKTRETGGRDTGGQPGGKP